MAASTENTHKTYQNGWRAFCSFMNQRLGASFPASSGDVQRFIAWLSLQRFAPSMIATYVSAVGYFYKIRGWPDPTRDFLVAKLLTGCRRDKPGGDTRWQMTLSILSRIMSALPQVCHTAYETALFRAAMLCAFFGFMRISEFASVSKTRIQRSLLLASDCIF